MTEPEIYAESDRVASRAIRLVMKYLKDRKKAALLASFDQKLQTADFEKELRLGKNTQFELLLEMLLVELSEYRIFLDCSEKKTRPFQAPNKAPSLFILFTEQTIMCQKVRLVLNELYKTRFPEYTGAWNWIEARKGGILVLPHARQEQPTAVTIRDLKKGLSMPSYALSG